MNGFSQHNINHLSASSINLWAACPHMWIAQYLFQKRSAFGAAARSGQLVEEAIVNVLARGFTPEAATESAMAQYSKFTAIGGNDSDAKRGTAMPDMIKTALEVLKPFGTPEFDKDVVTGDFKQKKIEINCRVNDWVIPIIGYLDLYYPAIGTVIDVKTTMRMPSEMSASHLRQASIYQHAMDNHIVKFFYTSGKKTAMFDCPDVRDILAEIKLLVIRLEAFLRLGDKELLRSIVPVVTDTFYSDADITKELYGI